MFYAYTCTEEGAEMRVSAFTPNVLPLHILLKDGEAQRALNSNLQKTASVSHPPEGGSLPIFL